MSSLADTVAGATTSIEQVSSRIEDAFARVGSQLARGHAMFQELNQSLVLLSGQLSGTEIEGASTALRDITGTLNRLSQTLPAESALLERIGASTAEGASLLKPLLKHIQMITVIARSARIEAASLDGDRDNFLAFTQEAYDLGNSVQRTIEGCARDQELLSRAVKTALERQKDFEQRYGAQLSAVGVELNSAHAGINEQRNNGMQLADLARTSTKTIAEAVGRAIISLQTGDSTRQRLEHICDALSRAAAPAPSLVPAQPDVGEVASLIPQLEGAQLKDAHRELDRDIGQIVRLLSAILADVSAVIGRSRSLYGDKDGGSPSFLSSVQQALAQASNLIATCESSGRSVDNALMVVEETLAKFRHAILGLSDAVVDITLIGMNAGLKAGHLGSKGNAFVVIANELKATADHVATGASRLRPILDHIEQVANELKELRVHGDLTRLTGLEPSILRTLRKVEAGDDRLAHLMNRVTEDGTELEGLMNAAQDVMATVGERAVALPSVAMRLEAAGTKIQGLVIGPGERAVLDELFARYTMERERDVHQEFLGRFGISTEAAVQNAKSDEDILLF